MHDALPTLNLAKLTDKRHSEVIRISKQAKESKIFSIDYPSPDKKPSFCVWGSFWHEVRILAMHSFCLSLIPSSRAYVSVPGSRMPCSVLSPAGIFSALSLSHTHTASLLPALAKTNVHSKHNLLQYQYDLYTYCNVHFYIVSRSKKKHQHSLRSVCAPNIVRIDMTNILRA